MHIVLWIVQALLAAVFVAAGLFHLARPKAALATNPNFVWTRGVSQAGIWGIGAAEVAGALGLMLPGVLHVLPVLVPLAGLGLCLLMAGAVVTHLRLREAYAPALALSLLSLLVFVGRLWAVRP